MIPGIDPRVDIAFKRLFGTPQWQNLTISLIEAVLEPAPWHQLANLELLNPYTEQIAMDDKMSILDIKARDDQGRLYNVEMQMVASVSLPQRLLYYWSLLYDSQLARGDDYSLLCPTISICFVNGRLFPDRGNCHHRFRLFDPTGMLVLTDDLDIHVLELANFQQSLDDLHSPLDLWLFFLKNGVTLDADELPAPLDQRDLRQAMEVLKMFSQDEMARELYQGRLKAERDARMHRLDAERAQAQVTAAQQQCMEIERCRTEAETRRTEAEQCRTEAEQCRTEAEQCRTEAEQRRTEAEQRQVEAEQRQVEAEQRQVEAEQRQVEAEQRQVEAEQRQVEAEQCQVEAEQRQVEAERQVFLELAKRIQLCERLLTRPITDETSLLHCSTSELQAMANGLEQELLRAN